MKIKQKIRIGTWNIRTINHGCKEALVSECDNYGIDVLGIAEHRMARQGHFRLAGGGVLYFSGREKSGLSGVGIYL